MSKQLKLSNKKVLLGVCGGIADYVNVDATVIRIITIILTFCGFVGIGLYLILWLVMYLAGK